ncbi:PTS mannitol transporter subunit IICBA [Candidatus Haliotispira prima]|uniref:protein-N(pi)-phosphohistidine--D-mannitol phosphotransferase n=1 Tax=Candidatus Haliotispira prima TaxID=3034016 RepID=A0ABY8MF40_9SPIO|nr:PTS mannitol transporter subunit IICBA [Candidatus Haliotispira prima]
MSVQMQIQKVGRFLSAMVMPNIGAFIAWGLITAFFIPTGWTPSETLVTLVGPMITYLLPLLIGFTGGKLVYGHRGGVAGAIGTIGVVIGSTIPMFLGAMIMGPLCAWIIKKFDEVVRPAIPAGFEMLVNNFSIGIIGGGISVLSVMYVGSAVQFLIGSMGAGVEGLVNMKLLPLVSIIVEPAKILFLNNAINHGVFTPLGTEQVGEVGRSMYYLVEANPGPGLGLLLAFMLFGKGNAKQSAPGSIIIHFLGGIHEIYFPYVLMKPRLIVAMIAGGMANVTTLMITGAGLVSPASPGSIIAVTLVTAKGSYFGVYLSVILGAVVTFVVSMLLLKTDRSTDEEDIEDMREKVREMKAVSKGGSVVSYANVKMIVVACDAGMGSSAMGATMLSKRIAAAGLAIEVKNKSIDALDSSDDLVITQKLLTDRARNTAPNAIHISIGQFLDKDFYDGLIQDLKNAK